MLWGDRSYEIVNRSYSEAKTQAETRRMEAAARRLGMLEDDWKDLLTNKIFSRYKSERLKSEISGIISTEYNVFRRLTNELSQVYKLPALRRIEGDKQQNAICQALWRESNIDAVLDQADKYLTALRDILIIPEVVAGRLRYRIVPPDRFTVLQHPDDPGSAVGFTYQRTLANTAAYGKIETVHGDVQQWQIWTAKGLDRRWDHGIGRLPALIVHAEERTGDDFFGDTVFSDVYEANLSVGCDLVMLTRLIKWQSEIQVTYKGRPRELAKGMGVGADNIWAAPGDFSSINLQADPGKLLEVIRFRIGSIAQSYGLAGDMYDLSASPSSGFQLRLKRMPLIEARARRVPTWRRAESELFRLTALICEREHPTLKPDSLADFRVDHTDEPMIEDPKTEQELFRGWIADGRMAPEEPLRRDNPDLSVEEAEALQRANLEKRAKIMEFMSSRNMSSDGEKIVERTAQENGAQGAAARGRPGKQPDDAFTRKMLEELGS